MDVFDCFGISGKVVAGDLDGLRLVIPSMP